MEACYVLSKDNIKIAINFYNQNKSTVIIIVHGWFMTKDSKPFLEMSKMFSEYFDVITMDCRGHGRSFGSYSFTVDEYLDIQAVVDFAKKRYNCVYLMGFSLGAASSLIYASKYNNIDKVISVSSPSDFYKIENNVLSYRAWFPTLKKCELKTWFSIRADLVKLFFYKKVKPSDIIAEIKSPVLLITGDKDPIVSKEHSIRLYKKSLNNCKFLEIKNGLHAEDLFISNNCAFVKMCIDWLNL